MTIYTWSSFSKRRNSTKQPTGGTSKSVTLKSPTSVIHPVFLLNSFSLSDNYLQWDNRFYYIDDIILVNNNLAEYHCSVDALASWKTSIGSMTEFVARSSTSYDGSICDMFYPSKAGIDESSVLFDSLHAATRSFRVSGGGGYYVVGVYGTGGGTGAMTYWILTPFELGQLVHYMFSDVWLDSSETDITIATQKQLINPMQYIASCFWYPFDDMASIGTGDVFNFGFWQTNLGAKILGVSDRKFTLTDNVTIPLHPDSGTRGSYLNDSPFTRLTMYCWGFGQIPIDPSAMAKSGYNSLSVQVTVDLFTGAGDLIIIAGLDLIGRYTCQIGIPMQLAQLTQDIQGSVVSGIGAVSNALNLNFGGAASSIGDAINSWIPRVSATGSTGSAIDYMHSPRIQAEFRRQTPMDATHNGRPLCQNVQISTLSGYIKTENADVDLPCTQEERDTIAAYMDGGFYYE